jgi:hypothetical protein
MVFIIIFLINSFDHILIHIHLINLYKFCFIILIDSMEYQLKSMALLMLQAFHSLLIVNFYFLICKIKNCYKTFETLHLM